MNLETLTVKKEMDEERYRLYTLFNNWLRLYTEKTGYCIYIDAISLKKYVAYNGLVIAVY